MRRLFYLTNIRLTAFSWNGRSLTEDAAFENDERGWRMFSDFLAEAASHPASLLVDLVEEDFQRDTVPHVLAGARRKLIERRLGQLYRDTPYSRATFQGREKEGRKDDRVLFTAITNTELMEPWMVALANRKVPLAGIYSVALLGPALFDKLGAGADPVLLITRQSGGLRQSYFHDGQLRFSRLTPLPEFSVESLADVMTVETAKTRQFLASTRQLPRDSHLRIVVVAGADDLAALQPYCIDTAETHYRFLAINEAAALLRINQADTAASCETLFLALIGKKSPPQHYARSEPSRVYRLWQARNALHALSVAALATGLLAAGTNLWDGYEASQQTERLDAETRSATARYQAIISSMPAIVASASDMKAAVDIERMFARNAPQPAPLLHMISQAFNAVPQLRLNRLQWQARDGDAPAEAPAPGMAEPAPSAVLIGIPRMPQQVVLLEGEVAPFNNDYRAALAAVTQLVTELRKQPQLQVDITRAPLDVSPTATLTGQSGNIDASTRAEFALKLVWKP